jgi:hypothetical protein
MSEKEFLRRLKRAVLLVGSTVEVLNLDDEENLTEEDLQGINTQAELMVRWASDLQRFVRWYAEDCKVKMDPEKN